MFGQSSDVRTVWYFRKYSSGTMSTMSGSNSTLYYHSSNDNSFDIPSAFHASRNHSTSNNNIANLATSLTFGDSFVDPRENSGGSSSNPFQAYQRPRSPGANTKPNLPRPHSSFASYHHNAFNMERSTSDLFPECQNNNQPQISKQSSPRNPTTSSPDIINGGTRKSKVKRLKCELLNLCSSMEENIRALFEYIPDEEAEYNVHGYDGNDTSSRMDWQPDFWLPIPQQDENIRSWLMRGVAEAGR